MVYCSLASQCLELLLWNLWICWRDRHTHTSVLLPFQNFASIELHTRLIFCHNPCWFSVYYCAKLVHAVAITEAYISAWNLVLCWACPRSSNNRGYLNPRIYIVPQISSKTLLFDSLKLCFLDFRIAPFKNYFPWLGNTLLTVSPRRPSIFFKENLISLTKLHLYLEYSSQFQRKNGELVFVGISLFSWMMRLI